MRRPRLTLSSLMIVVAVVAPNISASAAIGDTSDGGRRHARHWYSRAEAITGLRATDRALSDRRAYFLQLAKHHRDAQVVCVFREVDLSSIGTGSPTEERRRLRRAESVHRLYRYHTRLFYRYRRLAERPSLPFAPDPPMPK